MDRQQGLSRILIMKTPTILTQTMIWAFLLSVTGTIGLPGCSSHIADDSAPGQVRFQDAIDSWVGISQTELQDMMGPPSRVEVIGNKTQHSYYLIDGSFARTLEIDGFNPDDFDTFQCRFTVTYINDIVESVISTGRDCILDN